MVKAPTQTTANTEWLVGALKALADPQRLLILRELGCTNCCSCDEVPAESEGMCGCDIESVTGLSQPTVSHHIKLLEQAGLVKARKYGRWKLYQRADESVLRLAQELLNTLAPDCCVPSISEKEQPIGGAP